jgi:hypothetical protein
MAWFLNHYECDECEKEWTDEWSCMCDDDCPHCGARHMSPHESEELTHVIEQDGSQFVVLWSPETAEHDPDYRELGRFPTQAEAEAFLAAG